VALPLATLRGLQQSNGDAAWATALEYAVSVCGASIDSSNAEGIVRQRDDSLGQLDLFLATAGWDLWSTFAGSVPRTSDALIKWWASHQGGRAILLLDGLSLRELPWILDRARKEGFQIHSTQATAAELPGDTITFAKAIGFAQRSALANNGGGGVNFSGARTESDDLPWTDAAAQIKAEPYWFYWHHWPDTLVHRFADLGEGLPQLTRETSEQLASASFWHFVERLATGRRLIITSDHGYAVSGGFPDVRNEEHNRYLKEVFRGKRYVQGKVENSGALPAVAMELDTRNGPYTFALGRRKWKVAGGFPLLSHGGLSFLEVVVPFIELSR